MTTILGAFAVLLAVTPLLLMMGGVTWAHVHEITADFYFGGTGPQP